MYSIKKIGEMTAGRELKDINDRQDSLDVSLDRKINQSSSSSSSSSSSNDEQSEATEKAVPVRRNQNAARRNDDDDESVAEPAFQMSEYRSIHNFMWIWNNLDYSNFA